MLQLFIDTTGVHQTVALIENQKVLAQKKWLSNYNESETLLPAITSLLRKAQKTLRDLDQIVVARGPGSFSSTRIGVTVANTLGFALDIPIIGLKTGENVMLRLRRKIQTSDILSVKKVIVTPLYAKLPNITKGKGMWSRLRLQV